MNSTAISPEFPTSSGEIQAIDFARADEVQQKHELLNEYLELKRLDSLLILDPANFSWLTAGAENYREDAGRPIAGLLVTNEARVILCNNVDSGQIFDHQLAGMGFLLKERHWTEDLSILLKDVCRGRMVGCDLSRDDCVDVAEDLQPFRQNLCEGEIERLRSIGEQLAHALEATCRNFSQGVTEAEVAGHLAHRLIKNQMTPVRIQVMADGQGWRYRHWKYGEDHIERHCIISALVKRDGLHIAATRTVSFDTPPKELEQSHQLATLVQATGIYFSRPGWKFDETWKRVARIYEKFEIPDEWRAADQVEQIGYRPVECRLVPKSRQLLAAGQILHWHPSVRSSIVGDTFLTTETGVENLTPVCNWPIMSVEVKGTKVDRPGVLIR